MSSNMNSFEAPTHIHRVKRVKNHLYVKDGKRSYAHLLRKYNIKPTQDGPFDMIDEIHSPKDQNVLRKLQDRIAGRPNKVSHRRLVKKDANGQVGEVSAQDVQGDAEYLVPCWSTELPRHVQAEGKAAHHNIFNPAISHTWKPSEGEKWMITYGDGSSAGGNVGTDVVNIGGINVKHQAVELATTMSSEFQSGQGDGLMGLAWDSINTVTPRPVATPVQNMTTQSAIPASCELFTAHLGSVKDTNDGDHGSSFYTFGFIDQGALQANGATVNDIHWAPVDNSNGFWQIASTACGINGTIQPLAGNTAIMDTGTTLALVDSQTCKNIYAQIPGAQYDSSQGGYIFPTSTSTASLPVVNFDLGGKMFTLNREDLAFAPVNNACQYGAIQDRGDMPFSIYGDVVLKNIYAIFDVGNKRFGAVQSLNPDASCGSCGSCQSCS